DTEAEPPPRRLPVRMIDPHLGAGVARLLRDLATPRRRETVKPEIGRERTHRHRGPQCFSAQEAPPCAPCPGLELAGAEGDEVDRERVELVLHDGRLRVQPVEIDPALLRYLHVALEEPLLA